MLDVRIWGVLSGLIFSCGSASFGRIGSCFVVFQTGLNYVNFGIIVFVGFDFGSAVDTAERDADDGYYPDKKPDDAFLEAHGLDLAEESEAGVHGAISQDEEANQNRNENVEDAGDDGVSSKELRAGDVAKHVAADEFGDEHQYAAATDDTEKCEPKPYAEKDEEHGADDTYGVATLGASLVGGARCAFTIYFVGKVLRIDGFAAHLEAFLRGGSRRRNDGENDVTPETEAAETVEEIAEEGDGSKQKQKEYDAPDDNVAAEVAGETGQNASEHFGFGVAVKTLAAADFVPSSTNTFAHGLSSACSSEVITIAPFSVGAMFGGVATVGDVLQTTYALDNVLHMLDGDGVEALGVEFAEEFCDAGFNIVNDFLAFCLTAIVTTE